MSRPVRPAYTLLEMTLALAIALIILGAVYEFLNRQIFMAEVGRELVEESDLARTLLNRMSTDILSSLGAVDPQQLPGASSDAVTAALQAETFVPLFNQGVEGNASTLILSSSRVPRELLASDKRRLDAATLPRVSDLRRISYWMVEDDRKTGLAWQEVTAVTGSDFEIRPPDVPGAADLVIAPEVRGVMFEYFDGSAWQPTWSGSTLAQDGQTPLGPPAAIRITLTIKSKDGQRTRDYKHTVALPTGNNFLSQQLGF